MSCPAQGGSSVGVNTYNDGETYNSGATYGAETFARSGYESKVDGGLATGRSGANQFSVRVTHSSGALAVLHSVLPVMEIGSNQFTGHETFVDESCPERVSIRITHAASSLLRIDEARLVANMRSRRQPGV